MAKIAVIGDYMTDIWWCVSGKGTSQDSGCSRFGVGSVIEMDGGAGNVAKNLEKLGNTVLRLGYNPHSRFQNKKHRLYDTKTRTQIVRWDDNDYSEPLYTEDLRPLLDFQPDAIVISDYGKGAVTNEVVRWLQTNTRCPVYVDTKRGPEPYVAFTDRELVFFPNQLEYTAHKDLYNQFPVVFLKKGRFGAVILEYGVQTAESPATCPHPKSTCGAGDVTIAVAVHLATLSSGLDRGQSNLENIMNIVGESIDASSFTCQVKENQLPGIRINPYSRGREEDGPQRLGI